MSGCRSAWFRVDFAVQNTLAIGVGSRKTIARFSLVYGDRSCFGVVWCAGSALSFLNWSWIQVFSCIGSIVVPPFVQTMCLVVSLFGVMYDIRVLALLF